MPLVKRAVSPSTLCRQSLPRNIKSELECVTNNTLAGVIMQLSSLSYHAEDVFGELFTEANAFYNRSTKLQDRINNLSVKVTQLDSTVEEVSLHDINLKKAFRSNGITDQQVVSRESLPQSLKATYNKARKPPPLQELNQYRDDEKDALKIYTDPDYFFNLWREAMQKEMREAKEKRREQRKKERKGDPNMRREHKVRVAVPKSKIRAQEMMMGEEFRTTAIQNQVQMTDSINGSIKSNKSSPSIKIPPPEQNLPSVDLYTAKIETVEPQPPSDGGFPVPPVSNLPPPPPISQDLQSSVPYTENVPGPLPPINIPSPSVISNIPPPPLMETAIAPNPSPPQTQSGLAGALSGVRLKKAEDIPQPSPSVVDTRSGLLSAIRDGINLKKVEQREKTQIASSTGGANDVASILARRIAIDMSDSDTDSYSSDDADWD